jgi:hypothetical protein
MLPIHNHPASGVTYGGSMAFDSDPVVPNDIRKAVKEVVMTDRL